MRSRSQRIYQQIDLLEREPVCARTYVHFAEEYRWPLGAALAALALEVLLLFWRGPLP